MGFFFFFSYTSRLDLCKQLIPHPGRRWGWEAGTNPQVLNRTPLSPSPVPEVEIMSQMDIAPRDSEG